MLRSLAHTRVDRGWAGGPLSPGSFLRNPADQRLSERDSPDYRAVDATVARLFHSTRKRSPLLMPGQGHQAPSPATARLSPRVMPGDKVQPHASPRELNGTVTTCEGPAACPQTEEKPGTESPFKAQ